MFYTYNQNNAGGNFHEDENLAHYVIIEAGNADEANRIAKSKGIYFYGCSTGQDCECCGNRWPEKWEDDKGKEEPLIYDESPKDHKPWMRSSLGIYAYVYYLDNTKKAFYDPIDV